MPVNSTEILQNLQGGFWEILINGEETKKRNKCTLHALINIPNN